MLLTFRGELRLETIKIKPIAIGELMCLIPIILGVALKGLLSRQIMLPFGTFVGRDFVIFGFPFIMAFVHIFICLLIDIIKAGKGHLENDNIVVKAIVPLINYIFYLAIMIASVGDKLNVMKVAMFVLGTVLIVIAIFALYTDKVSIAKMRKGKIRSRQEIKFNRLVGIEALILGALFSGSVFLDKVFSTIFMCLLVATIIITVALAKTVKGRHRRG